MLTEVRNAPTRKKEVAPAIARDETRHRRMIVLAEAHDYVFERGDTLAFEVEDRPTQDLRQIKQ